MNLEAAIATMNADFRAAREAQDRYNRCPPALMPEGPERLKLIGEIECRWFKALASARVVEMLRQEFAFSEAA